MARHLLSAILYRFPRLFGTQLRMRLTRVALAVIALATGACTANITGRNPPGVQQSGGGTSTLTGSGGGGPGVTPLSGLPVMRRLTAREYDNTVADLLGDETHPAQAFDPDGTAAGFDNQVSLLSVSSSRARQYFEAAGRLADSADLARLTTCDAAQVGEEACATDFARSFGKRVFRRPLVDEELAILFKVYGVGSQGADHDLGLRQMLKAMLVMPPFLYRLDVTPGASGVPGTAAADPYQIASRLSYALIQSTPDAPLLQAADAGALSSGEQIAAQVARLLTDPRAQAMAQDFYDRWLGLDALDRISKNAQSFPKWNDGLRAALKLELGEFLKHSLWQEGGTLQALFGADHSFRNQLLSEHYGDSAATGTALTLTQLDPARSAGVLSLGGLMAILSTPEHTDPVHRGKFVRERLLCQTVPPPPPGVVAAFPAFDPNATTRQRFATHQKDPACASCHRMMDGIGLGFENLDAVGVFRTQEQGIAIDASGELVDTDVDGAFVGPRTLAEKLAASGQVAGCVSRTWFRFLTGREAGEGDVLTVEALQQALSEKGQRALLEAVTQTPAFLTRAQEDLP